MQIKLNNSVVTLEGSIFFNIHDIDIDEYRVELSDGYGWAVGTIDIDTEKNMHIIRKDEYRKYEDKEVENEFELENNGIVWNDETTFFDIHKIIIKRKYIELFDDEDEIIGMIHRQSIYDECAYIEYNKDGHICGNPQKIYTNGIMVI